MPTFKYKVKLINNKKQKVMKTELNEAAEKTLQDEINYWYEKTGSLTSEDIVRRAYSLGITTGAELQNSRMYSEEEVHNIITSYKNNKPKVFLKVFYNEWFEQFKKK
jgi:hypothetical protein